MGDDLRRRVRNTSCTKKLTVASRQNISERTGHVFRHPIGIIWHHGLLVMGAVAKDAGEQTGRYYDGGKHRHENLDLLPLWRRVMGGK